MSRYSAHHWVRCIMHADLYARSIFSEFMRSCHKSPAVSFIATLFQFHCSQKWTQKRKWFCFKMWVQTTFTFITEIFISIWSVASFSCEQTLNFVSRTMKRTKNASFFPCGVGTGKALFFLMGKLVRSERFPLCNWLNSSTEQSALIKPVTPLKAVKTVFNPRLLSLYFLPESRQREIHPKNRYVQYQVYQNITIYQYIKDGRNLVSFVR